MAVTPVRVTGVVLTTEIREVKRKSDGAEFIFRRASVLVANKGIVEVSYREDNQSDLPGEGELVDLLVSVGVYGGDATFDYVEPFSDESAASKRSLAAAAS